MESNGCEQIFYLRVENKKSCIIMCQAHLIVTLFSKPKFDCASEADTDFFIESLQKHFWKGCVKKYCENMCKLYAFYDFKN